MFDAVSYVMGQKKGKEEGEKTVIIQSGVTCTDDGDGNVTIKEAE